MLSIILGFITGLAGPISTVINNITDLKKMRAKADSDKEIKKIDAQIEEAHDKKAVLIAEAGNRIAGAVNSIFRVVIALPAVLILYKLAFDKIGSSYYGCVGKVIPAKVEFCKIFNTDALGTELALLIAAVVGFFFLTTWKK